MYIYVKDLGELPVPFPTLYVHLSPSSLCGRPQRRETLNRPTASRETHGGRAATHNGRALKPVA